MTTHTPTRHRNMVSVPAGTFVIGSDRHYEEEKPAHDVTVESFFLDLHPVTNAEFRCFVRDTGYVTIAERQLDPKDSPDLSAADPEPGSLVFTSTPGPVPLDDWRRWWCWTPGACWHTPEGPGSSLHGRELHPVVHIAYEDALSYAAHAGKRLTTEAEWERACRAGRPATEYAWGEEFAPLGRHMANTWHGQSPWERLSPHGHARTSSVGRFRANDWGFVDMIGNVWEWTSTPWTYSHAVAPPRAEVRGCCAVALETVDESDRRVIKGGSHLCAPSYCHRYRPTARQGHGVRSSTGHVGFRCASDSG